MTFAAAMLAEMDKPGGEFYKRVTINFPKTTETITLQPDATELADTSHSAQGAGTFHEALDDAPASPDDDTTYVRHDANDLSAESRVSFPDLPSWVVEITEVRVFCRAKSNSTVDAAEDDGGWLFSAYVNSTNYYGDIENKRFFNPAYRTMVIRFPTSPDTLADWTVAELNALQVAIISQPDDVGDQFGQRFTQVYVEVDATRSQTGRYSDVSINSREDGLYVDQVIDWEDISYSAAGTSNAIQRPTAGVLIADPDQGLNQIFAGSGVDDVRRAPVTIEYVSPNVDRANWVTVFTGILESWDEVKAHQWKLSFAEDDSSWDGDVPKSKISEITFPDADPKEFNEFEQVIYGRHISAGSTDDGMVPCPNLDTVNFIRGVARHKVFRVVKVYSKGNTEDPALLRTEGTSAGDATTAEYEVLTPVYNGKQYTILQFNLTGASDDEKEKFNELSITADVEGIEEVGDGTGFLITNPATIAKHFYVNWVANDYGSGEWLPDTAAPVDTDIIEETRLELNTLGQESSRFIGGIGSPQKARALFNGFCEDLHIRPFWTEAGLVAFRPNTPFTLDVYPDEWFQQGLHDIGNPNFRYDVSDVFDRILLSHIHQANGNQFLANIEIRDFEAGDQKAETFSSHWLPSGIIPT